MKNLMARDMILRYEEYFHIRKLEEKGAEIIYFWVMSTLESFFWGPKSSVGFQADLYAKEQEMFLVMRDSTRRDWEFVHQPTYNCENGKLPIMLKKFIEIFNNVEYPDTEFSVPKFSAYYDETWHHPKFRTKYNGYYHVSIFVDMLRL